MISQNIAMSHAKQAVIRSLSDQFIVIIGNECNEMHYPFEHPVHSPLFPNTDEMKALLIGSIDG